MNADLESQLAALCQKFLALPERHKLVFLTGAGLSAESGLPTFRGGDGYWTEGSVNYTPQEVATLTFFEHQPWIVWKWTQQLTHAIVNARPNTGHEMIARIDQKLGDRCRVITQNVDNYHQLAGTDPTRVFEIHGNAMMARCGDDCQYPPVLVPVPAPVLGPEIDFESKDMRCAECGAFLRPHALFFDEMYNDELYNLHNSLRAVQQAGMLVIVGTAGATSLPVELVETAYDRGIPIVDINPERDPFADKAEERGVYLPHKAGEVLPTLAAMLGV